MNEQIKPDAARQLQKELRLVLRAIARDTAGEHEGVGDSEIGKVLDDTLLSEGFPRSLRRMFIAFAVFFFVISLLGVIQVYTMAGVPVLLVLGMCGLAAEGTLFIPIRRSYAAQSMVDRRAKYRILRKMHADGLVGDREFARVSRELLGDDVT